MHDFSSCNYFAAVLRLLHSAHNCCGRVRCCCCCASQASAYLPPSASAGGDEIIITPCLHCIIRYLVSISNSTQAKMEYKDETETYVAERALRDAEFQQRVAEWRVEQDKIEAEFSQTTTYPAELKIQHANQTFTVTKFAPVRERDEKGDVKVDASEYYGCDICGVRTIGWVYRCGQEIYAHPKCALDARVVE